MVIHSNLLVNSDKRFVDSIPAILLLEMGDLYSKFISFSSKAETRYADFLPLPIVPAELTQSARLVT